MTVFVSIFSASATTIAGDRILTIFSNFVLLCAGLVVANQSIVGSFEMLRRKKININTMISISAIICFFQSLLMLIFYFADKNTVSVFSGAGLVLLLTGEINNYIVHSRMAFFQANGRIILMGDNTSEYFIFEQNGTCLTFVKSPDAQNALSHQLMKAMNGGKNSYGDLY